MHPDPLIAQLASKQHSAIARQQLLHLGLTDRQVDYRVETGMLLVEHPGTYVMAGSQRTYEQKVMTACLASGGVASHRCAAALFRLRGCRRGLVEVTVEGSRAPIRRGSGAGGRWGSRGHFAAPGGRRLPGREAADGKCIGGCLSWRSWPATAFPEPHRQYQPSWEPRRRVDFARPEDRLLIELDGRLWHTSASDRERDRAKDERAAAQGWRTERITWIDIHDTPARVIERLEVRRAA
jgi:hypothetical protein